MISEMASELGVVAHGGTCLYSQSWGSIFHEPGRREKSVLITTGIVCQGQDVTRWLRRVSREDSEYKGEREERKHKKEPTIKFFLKACVKKTNI